MPRRARRHRRQRAGHAAIAQRRTRRAAQHVLGCACGPPFLSDELYAEVTSAAPYAALTRADFDAAVDFVATGGYALKAYERFARIRHGKDGRWRIANPWVAQRYRLNVGTIVEADMLKVRLVRSRVSRMIRAAAGCWAKWRNISSRPWCPATPSCSPAKFCNTRPSSKTKCMSRARRRKIRRCRLTKAASFRCRLISPNACAASSPIRKNGGRFPRKCASGWKSSNGARRCRASASSWSKLSRAPTNTTLSAIRSKAVSPIKRSACC